MGVCGGDVTRRDPRNTNGDERLESMDCSNFRWWDARSNYIWSHWCAICS